MRCAAEYNPGGEAFALPGEGSASCVSRLAEAADGFRDGKYYYFISKLNYDYDVHWASGDTDNAASSAADTLKNQLGTDYYKFGPYKTDTNDPPLLNYDSIELRLLVSGWHLQYKHADHYRQHD